MSTTDTKALSPKAAIRDQAGDQLLTPKNSAMVVIDYQPSQLAGVRSMDPNLLLKNAVSPVKVVSCLAYASCIDHQVWSGWFRREPSRSAAWRWR